MELARNYRYLQLAAFPNKLIKAHAQSLGVKTMRVLKLVRHTLQSDVLFAFAAVSLLCSLYATPPALALSTEATECEPNSSFDLSLVSFSDKSSLGARSAAVPQRFNLAIENNVFPESKRFDVKRTATFHDTQLVYVVDPQDPSTQVEPLAIVHWWIENGRLRVSTSQANVPNDSSSAKMFVTLSALRAVQDLGQ